jgi:hypothetical protein
MGCIKSSGSARWRLVWAGGKQEARHARAQSALCRFRRVGFVGADLVCPRPSLHPRRPASRRCPTSAAICATSTSTASLMCRRSSCLRCSPTQASPSLEGTARLSAFDPGAWVHACAVCMHAPMQQRRQAPEIRGGANRQLRDPACWLPPAVLLLNGPCQTGSPPPCAAQTTRWLSVTSSRLATGRYCR